jgi:hypothetical protein
VYGSAVSRSGKHQTVHILWDPYLLLFWEVLLLWCLVVVVSLGPVGVSGLLSVIEGCYSVLPPKLLPRVSRQVVNYFTRQPDAGHSIENGFI